MHPNNEEFQALQEEVLRMRREQTILKETWTKFYKELDDRYQASIKRWRNEADRYSEGLADGYDISGQLIETYFRTSFDDFKQYRIKQG